MRRRRGTEEIQLLSTSFLDLLCCGLCSVVLLWVLLTGGPPPAAESPYGIAQIGQTGLWHWRSVELWSRDGVTKLAEVHRGQSEPEIEMAIKEASKHGLTVFVRKGLENEFAGLLILAADRRTEDLQARVHFSQCEISTDIHVIHVSVQSSGRSTEDTLTFTKPNELSTALGNGPGPVPANYLALRERYGNVRHPLPITGPAAEALLRFDITHGTIRYLAP